MKLTTKILVACLPGIVTGALLAATTDPRSVSKPNEAALAKAKSALAKMPLSFEPNRGQTDPRVQYLTRGPGYIVYFTQDETVMSLTDTKSSNAVVRMKFVGGTNSATAKPVDALTTTSNYLVGNDSSKWLSGIAQYSKLRYENVYPGIDVVYTGDQKQLRYDFIVKPGADAHAIQMAFEGAENLSVTKDGNLALTIDGKTLVTTKPFTYQEEAGAKKEIASHFVVNNGKVTFELAKYDTTKDLVIDPSVVFVTFLGGGLNDAVNGVAIVNPTLTISSAPSAYFVTGSTNSPNFPTTAGVLPTCGATPTPGCNPGGLSGNVLSGAQNIFVTKISFNGTQNVWTTYIGGNSRDSGAAIAVDISNPAGGTNCSAGCPVITGQAQSVNFPTAPFQGVNSAPALQGGSDAYAVKLAVDGKSFVYSVLLGGGQNDQGTGVAINNNPGSSSFGDAFIGGYTDSATFLGKTNSGNPSSSSDAFVVKIPVAYNNNSTFNIGTTIIANLYGGFGEEFTHAIAYNATNNMVYLGGDTTTGKQNFIAPNNKDLPVSNTTALPGPGPNARGGFLVAFDATNLITTWSSYLAVSPAGSPNFETITGIAAEGGCSAALGSPAYVTCPTVALGNIGHVYVTGVTTSNVPSGNIAKVVPQVACTNGVAASSILAGKLIIGPAGTPITTAGGTTIPAGCVTSLITQAPFNTNQAVTTGCQFPLPLGFVPTPTCNLSAYVAIIDGALLTAPGTNPAPVGNQIEYWAYYSSANASTVANALAIDSNPTTQTSTYSLGTYQQMYITGSSQLTTNTATTCLTGQAGTQTVNCLPMTRDITPQVVGANNSTFLAPSEIFTSYNVGTTTGGGVGGYTPNASIPVNEIDAYVARFNANGLAASSYGGQGNAASANPNLMGYGCPTGTVWGVLCNGQTVAPNDHSQLIHTPQFNYGEFIYGNVAQDGSSTPNTVGNAIAVDPTRAALIGGATNVSNSATGKGCVPLSVCNFSTTNALAATNSGGTDGWASVLFFNDILTNAAAQASANPWIQPLAPQRTPPAGTASGACATLGNCSYIETTPAPFGPTFDFAISDPVTQTQTFQVLFTGQASGQLQGVTPWWVPVDARSGASQPTLDNNEPGSGIAYYIPCVNPATVPTTFTFNPAGAASQGYYNNAYPAPGGAYGPMTCAFPSNHLYEGLPLLFSGYPGLTNAQSNGTLTTPGWLVLSQDINPGVVRMQLDRRAAAGLLEGTYIAQFLVTTYDSQEGLYASRATQWPPCGPQSTLNPYTNTNPCGTASTPLPADNVSVLVTVRLIVRPALFLSRNAGITTGITSSLSSNPLSGPTATIAIQNGTSRVPNWLYTGTANDIVTFPPLTTLYPGIAGIPGILNVNAGPGTCAAGTVAGSTVATVINLLTVPAGSAGNITIPCPVSATAPAPYTGAIQGGTAYLGNGPGDGTTGVGPGPNMTFLYDLGTVLTITPGPLTACKAAASDQINNSAPNTCNLAGEQNLAPTRPDQPNAPNAPIFNAAWQGGVDPVTQRNDATVHKYYTTAEGAATLSVAAINCTNWNSTTKNAAVGNWLAVRINDAAANGTPANYTPICTDQTTATVGTVKAPATFCKTGCTYTSGTGIGDDVSTQAANYPLSATNNGQLIALDFLTKAFSNRPALNGIPTGTYNANVYVWATRAKNSVPGYCLGASMPISAAGVDPTPLCPTSVPPADSGNPHPLVTVTLQQTFNVSLLVFDTTQVIQITPNSCQPTSLPSITEFAGVLNSENLFTGNIAPPFGPGSFPNYPNFGPNSDDLVEWSLLPFQTTGTSITGCFDPNQICAIGSNQPVQLPVNVSVDPQTLAQYNACALPTGKFNGSATFNGQTVNGAFVPGIGSLVQTGPISSTTFLPAGTGANTTFTIYACRPTVAPAWLNSPNYPGNALGANFPGGPSAWANGNGPNGGPSAQPIAGAIGSGPVPSISGKTCPLAVGGPNPPTQVTGPSKLGVFRNGNSFLEDKNNNNTYDAGVDRFISTFFTPPGPIVAQAGDIAVAGDWTGDGFSKVGIYRPSTGTWYLDANNNGIFDAGDFTYNFGGLVGDLPVVGDWNGVGKSCVGIYRSNGSVWLLDLNCNGTFDNTPTDAFFPFGGLPGDLPVVGKWTGTTTKVGVVRKYAPGGVPQGPPFFWVLDAGNANAGNTPANHPSAAGAFAFGGLACTSLFPGCTTIDANLTGDIFVVGDWLGTGTDRAGIYRGGSWIEDLTGAHTADTFFQFGGLASDTPVVGKWDPNK